MNLIFLCMTKLQKFPKQNGFVRAYAYRLESALESRHHLGYRVNTGKPGRLIARFHSYYEWNCSIA